MNLPPRTHGAAQGWMLSRGRGLLLALLAVPLLLYGYFWYTFPSDQTPEGAYLRIARAVNEDRPEGLFAYTEEEAQHACFTIGDYRRQALEVAEEKYPPQEFERLRDEYGAYARAKHGDQVFALIAREQGWMSQLRRDVSGIAKVEIEGPRATIETAKGTRYSMRQRPNGIWGLSAFTATLVDEAERAARDLEQVKKAASDFARVAQQQGLRPASP